MDKDISIVEIEDPPIQKFNKKKSCLRRSCVTGGGCFVFVLAGAILLVIFASNPRPEELDKVPDAVRTAVPLYDEKSIEQVTYVASDSLPTAVKKAADVAKIILTPARLLWEMYGPSPMANPETQPPAARAIHTVFENPDARTTNEIILEWTDMPATSRVILNYYRKELGKSGYGLETLEDTDHVRKIRFKKSTIDGTLTIYDDLSTQGADRVQMIIETPGGFGAAF